MNDTEKLINEAAEDQLEDSTNTTYAEGNEVFEPTESAAAEQFTDTEGDVAASEEPKEEWAKDIQQNQAEIEADIPDEVGTGAFAKMRSTWANGWGS